jgi:hypothetical protein
MKSSFVEAVATAGEVEVGVVELEEHLWSVLVAVQVTDWSGSSPTLKHIAE